MDLAQFAKQHRVHYDVEPELVEGGGAREAVAYEFRLFATHGTRLGVPGCEKCVELARDLTSFAQELVADGELASRADVLPASPALYESTEERDVDEVALTLRVRCDAPERHGSASGGDDPCTREIRERLAAAGVRQG